MTSRISLILALAVARLSDHEAPMARTARWAGRVVSTARDDGAMIVDTGRQLVMLVLVSDTVLREADGRPLTFDDVAAGDVLEWQAERREGITVVQELTRLETAVSV